MNFMCESKVCNNFCPFLYEYLDLNKGVVIIPRIRSRLPITNSISMVLMNTYDFVLNRPHFQDREALDLLLELRCRSVSHPNIYCERPQSFWESLIWDPNSR